MEKQNSDIIQIQNELVEYNVGVKAIIQVNLLALNNACIVLYIYKFCPGYVKPKVINGVLTSTKQ